MQYATVKALTINSYYSDVVCYVWQGFLIWNHKAADRNFIS